MPYFSALQRLISPSPLVPHLFLILFILLDTALLYRLTRNPISIPLYLFSTVILSTADYATAVHLASFLLILGLYSDHRQKPLLAGLFFTFSALTKLYILVPVFIYLMAKTAQTRKAATLLAFLAFFLALNLLFSFLFGPDYIRLVYLDNFGRGLGIPKLRLFLFFTLHDLPLILLALPSLKANSLYSSPLLGTLLFILLFPDTYYLYFNLCLPFLVILATAGLGRIPSFQKPLFHLILATTLIFQTLIYQKTIQSKNKIEDYPRILSYLQTRSGPIFGNYQITPLLALDSSLPILKNRVDTNPKFLQPGRRLFQTMEKDLSANPQTTVITKGYFPPGKAYLDRNCNLLRSFPQSDPLSTIRFWSCHR